MRPRSTSIVAAVSLLWLVFVLVIYYAGHKPAEPAQLLALMTSLCRILAAAGITLLAGGLGAGLLRDTRLDGLTLAALQAGLGFGLLGIGLLVVGSVLGLPAWLPWAAAALLGLVLRRFIAAWLRQWGEFARLWRESGPFERILAGCATLIFLGALALALAPPLQFDSLVYHLALPDAYLQAGKVAYFPWHVMSGMPQTAEMLFTWAAALGGHEAAAVLGWCFGLLAAAGLLGSLRHAFDARAAWVGLAAILAGFTPALLLSSAYVDWLVFLEALGALVFLAEWRRQGDRRSLWMAGAFTGLAVGSKYTSGVLALAGLVVLAVQLRRKPLDFLKSGLQFGLAAAVAAAPWILKNLLTTGNPVYPFFFNGGAMTAVRAQVYQSGPPFGDWLDLFFLPVRAASLGFDAGEGYMFAPGILLLGLGGLAWLGRFFGSPPDPNRPASPSGSLVSTSAVLAAAGLVMWAVGNQFSGNLIQTRYYFSIFPAFVVLAAAGDCGLRRVRLGSARLGRIGAALVVLALGLTTLEFSLVVFKGGAPQAALGLKSSEAYLADALGWFEPAMKAARELPEGSQAQLLYEARSLYCAPRCRPDEILDRWKLTYGQNGNRAAILQSWRDQGITHLLVYRQGMRFLREVGDPHHPPSDLDALEQLLATLPRPVNFGDVYELYSLVSRGG